MHDQGAAIGPQMALGFYEAVRPTGFRVPQDVSAVDIVGFDDLRESRWVSPSLTTVRQPLSEMGMLAARTTLRLVKGEPIVRHGTAAPAANP